MRYRSVLGLCLGLAIVVACGSESSPSSPPADAPSGDIGALECGRRDGGKDDTCSTEAECCVASVADGPGPEGYRCTSGTWKRNQDCDPPAAKCESPLSGTISSTRGKVFTITCFDDAHTIGVVGARLTLGTGDTVEIYFSRVPANETFDVVAYEKRSQLPAADAGGTGVAVMRVGKSGGFGGFEEKGRSESGTMKIESVEAQTASDGRSTTLRSLKATFEVKMVAGTDPDWNDTFTASW